MTNEVIFKTWALKLDLVCNYTIRQTQSFTQSLTEFWFAKLENGVQKAGLFSDQGQKILQLTNIPLLTYHYF